MASAPEDTIFRCKLDFDGWPFEKGMKKGNGVLKSETFEIRGLPWQFYLRMSKTKLRYQFTTSDEEDYERNKDDSTGWYSPHLLTINGVPGKPISNYFSVQLCVENPEVMESELNRLELCGALRMQQTSAGHRYPSDAITGVMFQPFFDPFEERLSQKEVRTGYLKYGHYGPEGKRPQFNGWFFGTESPTLIDTQNWEDYTFEPIGYRDFYTVGKVPRLVVELKIGIPSKFKKIFKGLA